MNKKLRKRKIKALHKVAALQLALAPLGLGASTLAMLQAVGIATFALAFVYAAYLIAERTGSRVPDKELLIKELENIASQWKKTGNPKPKGGWTPGPKDYEFAKKVAKASFGAKIAELIFGKKEEDKLKTVGDDLHMLEELARINEDGNFDDEKKIVHIMLIPVYSYKMKKKNYEESGVNEKDILLDEIAFYEAFYIGDMTGYSKKYELPLQMTLEGIRDKIIQNRDSGWAWTRDDFLKMGTNLSSLDDEVFAKVNKAIYIGEISDYKSLCKKFKNSTVIFHEYVTPIPRLSFTDLYGITVLSKKQRGDVAKKILLQKNIDRAYKSNLRMLKEEAGRIKDKILIKKYELDGILSEIESAKEEGRNIGLYAKVKKERLIEDINDYKSRLLDEKSMMEIAWKRAPKDAFEDFDREGGIDEGHAFVGFKEYFNNYEYSSEIIEENNLQKYFKRLDSKELDLYFKSKRDKNTYLSKIVEQSMNIKNMNSGKFGEEIEDSWKKRWKNYPSSLLYKEKLFIVFDGGVFDSSNVVNC